MGLVSEGDIGFDGLPLQGHVDAVGYFEELCAGGRNPKVVINWSVSAPSYIILTLCRMIHSLKGELSSLDKHVPEYPPLRLMGELIDLVEGEVVTRSSGRLLLRHIVSNQIPQGATMKDLARSLQLLAFSAEPMAGETEQNNLYEVCGKAIQALPSEVTAIRAGNKKVINKVVGWVIRETRGRADAQMVRELVVELVMKQPDAKPEK